MSSGASIISCVTCGEVFEKKTAMYKHRQNKHPKSTTFQVGEREYDLIQGNQNGKFICPICGCPVSGMNNLRRHVIKCAEKYESDSNVESTSEHSQSDEGEQRITENDCLSLDGLGFHVDHQWKVASCKNCCYIVDPARIIQQVTKANKLAIPDMEQARNTIQASGLRLHLAVLSRSSQHDYLSSDDDREALTHQFSTSGFLPGSTPVKRLPIYLGFKCMIGLDTCTLKQTAMRSHTSRHHPAEEANYTPVSNYVMSKSQFDDEDEYSSHSQELCIPADVEQVRGHDMVVERRDRNQFGDKFGAHHLLENVINFEELKPWLLKPTMKHFQELKRLTVVYLQDCWTHVRTGFQTILAKVMQFDENRHFLHAVQQQQAILNYGVVWTQVLWLGCMAVTANLYHRHDVPSLPAEYYVAPP
ncbi:hypothetical protein V1515DRAFT_624179 [Lipomyces mesembrius]